MQGVFFFNYYETINENFEKIQNLWATLQKSLKNYILKKNNKALNFIGIKQKWCSLFTMVKLENFIKFMYLKNSPSKMNKHGFL